MVDRLPVDRLYHPGVIVRDARATAKNYAELFGINEWNVIHYGPKHISQTRTHGLPASHSFTCAYGRHEESGLLFQLVEPQAGDNSTYAEFIAARGEGVHNLCTTIVTQPVFEDLREWFGAHGVEVGQSATIDDVVDWYIFDTREALGGFYVTVVVPRTAEWMDAVQSDEQWDFSKDVSRPKDVGPIPLIRVPNMHFGVVVRDVVGSMRRYAELMGMEKVTFMDIGSAEAPLRSARPTVVLTNSTHNGKRVAHRIFNSVTMVAEFGFEVIQTTIPPIHYKEDYLDVVGEGIHHFYATLLPSDDEWNKLNRWMESLGIPVVQSGEVHPQGQAERACTYLYWDTRERLGGYVLEVIVNNPDAGTRPEFVPALTLDFAATDSQS